MSKVGDYAPPQHGHGHRITVNAELNEYDFLITLTHEVAHLVNWTKHGQQVDPHGKEWKNEFRKLMIPLLRDDIFPDDVIFALNRHLNRPSASCSGDLGLMVTLRKYNNPRNQWLFLAEVENGRYFKTRSGKVFRKIRKMRKNFLCIELYTDHEYTVNPGMEVKLLTELDVSNLMNPSVN